MIEDGISGLLADPASAKDFSDKIGRLLDDPHLASRLALHARERVAERFSLDKCLEATERFYSECMSGRPGRAEEFCLIPLRGPKASETLDLS
jgi:glycosyltransferase involved in cell wall biosynthesis